MLLIGSVVEVDRSAVHVCSPLGVVPKKNGKFLDLHYINSHLAKFKFKYEDLRVVADIVQQGDWFFNFDLQNDYYHVDICELFWKYFAFAIEFNSSIKYFMFCSLPFRLSTAPSVFTKLLQPVVAFWRSDGMRISVYLDDGLGVDSSRTESPTHAIQVQRDLTDLGFLINQEKSDCHPRQVGEHLGFTVDLVKGEFSVPRKKTDNLVNDC